MPYIQNALALIIETFVGLYLIAIILRFLLELLGVDFRNPLVQTVVLITNPPLRAVRGLVPGLYGIDLAAVILIWILGLFKLALRLWAADYSFNWSGAMVLSAANGVNAMVWVFLIAVLIRVVLSWVAPGSWHPAARVIDGLSEPVMAPFRRILPPMGGLDLSPILTLLALRMVQQLVVAPLMDFGAGLL